MATTKKNAAATKPDEKEKAALEQAQKSKNGGEAAAAGNQPAEHEDPAAGENKGDENTPAQPALEEVERCNCWVYIGPSLPNSRLNKNHVMRGTRNEITSYLAGIIKDFPQVARLVVSLDRLAEQKQKVRNSGTAMHKLYQDIVSTAQAKKEA